MMRIIAFEEQCEIPMDLASLDDFRRWALSDRFPRRGRIDYIAGRIEVDMSPEELYSHGLLKSEVVGLLWQLVKAGKLGLVFTSDTRIADAASDLSAEPDVVYLSHQSVRSGRVRLTPKAGGEPGRFVEIEGGPDVVAEIVSDSSAAKDRQRLPPAYFRAGVREYWLADARRPPAQFQIHHRGATGFEPVEPDAAGYQRSEVFDRRFRLDGSRDAEGLWQFDLRMES